MTKKGHIFILCIGPHESNLSKTKMTACMDLNNKKPITRRPQYKSIENQYKQAYHQSSVEGDKHMHELIYFLASKLTSV